MDIELFRFHCLNLKGATESMPFGDGAIVYKVGNKMFALLRLEPINLSVNLKCDPELAQELRESFPDLIIGGYHMNKRHWNTLFIEKLADSLIMEQLVHSYELVFNSLPAKIKSSILE